MNGAHASLRDQGDQFPQNKFAASDGDVLKDDGDVLKDSVRMDQVKAGGRKGVQIVDMHQADRISSESVAILPRPLQHPSARYRHQLPHRRDRQTQQQALPTSPISRARERVENLAASRIASPSRHARHDVRR